VDGEIARDLVLARLWGLLPEDAREDARRLALLRTPAPREVADVVTPAWRTLEHAGLLTLVREQGTDARGVSRWLERWAFLAVVRDFVLGQGALGDVGAAHRAWADAWGAWMGASDEWRAVDVIERVQHLHAIKAGNEAWPLLRPLVIKAANSGDFRGAFALVVEVESGGATNGMAADAHLSKAMILTRLGRYDLALAEAQLAAELSRSLYQRAAANVASSEALTKLGKYPEAESLLRQTIQMSARARSSPNNTVFLTAQHELAGALLAQGKYPEAESELRSLLHNVEKALGKKNPSYYISQHDLATVLARQGRYPEAELLLGEVLTANLPHLGKEHPFYAASQHELAWVFVEQGKFDQAKPLLYEALASKEKRLGKEHPDYSSSQYVLARIYAEQGRPADAETLLFETLHCKEKALGIEHPSLIPVLNLLAQLVARRQPNRALDIVLRALTIARKTHLDSHHADVAFALAIQADIEVRLGRPEARDTIRQALSSFESALGANHPSTQRTRAMAVQLGAIPFETVPLHAVPLRVQQFIEAGKASEAVVMLSTMAEQAQHADQAQHEFFLRTLLAQAAHATNNITLVRAALNRAATLASALPPDAARVLTELRSTLGVPTTP
jgi:tetratricopeptide (TPR) repeat protein